MRTFRAIAVVFLLVVLLLFLVSQNKQFGYPKVKFGEIVTVTYVVGKDHTIFSEEPGRWVVYQNGSIVAEGAMNATMTIPKFVVWYKILKMKER